MGSQALRRHNVDRVCLLALIFLRGLRGGCQLGVPSKKKAAQPETHSDPVLDFDMKADHAAACFFVFFYVCVCLGSRFSDGTPLKESSTVLSLRVTLQLDLSEKKKKRKAVGDGVAGARQPVM